MSPQYLALHADQLLRTLARESVLVGRRLGQGLVRLAEMDGFAALGYSCLENYAAQRLGMSGRSAQELAWMERKLQRYPAVESAFMRGALSFSHVRLLLRAVRTEDEEEWVRNALQMTVAQLEQALEEWKAGGNGAAASDEMAAAYTLRAPQDEAEPPHRIRCHGEATVALKLDLAVEVVRRMHGADLAVGACMEFIITEFLTGAGGAALASRAEKEDDSVDVPGAVLPWRRSRTGEVRLWRRDLEIGLAEITERWASLNWTLPPIPAPLGVPQDADAVAVDVCLQRIVSSVHVREVDMMRLLAIVANDRLYDLLEFTSLQHYAAERLAMSARTAWSLVSLYRRIRPLPRTWQAYQSGRISKTQSDLISRVATAETEDGWIEHARGTTVKCLRQDVQAACRLRDFDSEAFVGPPAPETCAAERMQTCAADGVCEEPMQMCAADGVSEQLMQTCAADGVSEEPMQTCAADGVSEQPMQTYAVDGVSEQLMQTCAADGVSEQLMQTCAADAADRTPVSGTAREARDTHVQTCAPFGEARFVPAINVARLGLAERLRFFTSDHDIEVEPGPMVPIHFLLPRCLTDMWRQAFRACEIIYGGWATVAECIEACVDAFLHQWAPQALADIRAHRILERDGWICANPTCTRRALLHDHHVEFRSQGGSDSPSNRLTLCRQCHLRLVHTGQVRVRGTAPDHLTWELGVRRTAIPHLLVVGRRIVGGTASTPAPVCQTSWTRN